MFESHQYWKITSESQKRKPCIVEIHYCPWYPFLQLRRYNTCREAIGIQGVQEKIFGLGSLWFLEEQIEALSIPLALVTSFLMFP